MYDDWKLQEPPYNEGTKERVTIEVVCSGTQITPVYKSLLRHMEVEKRSLEVKEADALNDTWIVSVSGSVGVYNDDLNESVRELSYNVSKDVLKGKGTLDLELKV